MFLSIITKNSDWEILTKNLVIEVKLGLKMKNPIFRRGGCFTKNQYRGECCLKRGTWTVCWFKGRCLGRKREWFLRGGRGLIPHVQYNSFIEDRCGGEFLSWYEYWYVVMCCQFYWRVLFLKIVLCLKIFNNNNNNVIMDRKCIWFPVWLFSLNWLMQHFLCWLSCHGNNLFLSF